MVVFFVFTQKSSYDVDKWMAEAPLDNRRRADISLTDPSDEASMMSGLVSLRFLLYFSRVFFSHVISRQPSMWGREMCCYLNKVPTLC